MNRRKPARCWLRTSTAHHWWCSNFPGSLFQVKTCALIKTGLSFTRRPKRHRKKSIKFLLVFNIGFFDNFKKLFVLKKKNCDSAMKIMENHCESRVCKLYEVLGSPFCFDVPPFSRKFYWSTKFYSFAKFYS